MSAVFAWWVIDHDAGTEWGGGSYDTPTYMASTSKPWLAQDALTLLVPERNIEGMIRDSDNAAATRLAARLGITATMGRLAFTCGLKTLQPPYTSWSRSLMSTRDMAHMIDCISEPRVLVWMTQIRGYGQFGVWTLMPGVIVKNGWMEWGGTWYVNCLGRGQGWSIAVTVQFPSAGYWWDDGFAEGQRRCNAGLTQLIL